MHAFRRLVRQHALIGFWALALALLVSMGWGQVHRVLHPGALTFTAADAGAKVTVPGLGDDEGSSLCKLLDHLTHGAGPALAMAVILASEPPVMVPTTLVPSGHAAVTRNFDARAPPALT
jgi:hypothetical protein